MNIGLHITLLDLDKNLWTEKADVSVWLELKKIGQITVSGGKGRIEIHPFYLGKKAKILVEQQGKIKARNDLVLTGKSENAVEIKIPCDMTIQGTKKGRQTIHAKIQQNNAPYTKKARLTLESGGVIHAEKTVTNGEVSFETNWYDAAYALNVYVESKKQPVRKSVTVYKTRTIPEKIVVEIPAERGTGETKRGTESVQTVTTEVPYWYYRPETGEIIEIADKVEALRIQKESNELTALVIKMQKANEAVNRAVNNYDAKPSNVLANEVDKKNEVLLKEQENFRKKLVGLGIKTTPKSGNQLIELIPLSGKYTNNKSKFNRKFTYATGPKKAAHWKNYKLGKPDAPKDSFPFVEKGKNGKYRIDSKKLIESIQSNAKFSAGKIDTSPFEGILTDWAKEWSENANASYSNGMIDLGASAQFMRYTAGAGAALEFNPAKGSMCAKASANASFAIAQGGGALDFYLPTKSGLHFSFSDLDMGRFRVLLSVTISGFLGASVAAEAGVQIIPYEHVKGKYGLAGVPVETTNPAPYRAPKGRAVPIDRYKEGDKLDVSADIFVGASGNASFTGAVEWASPETNKFKQFASITPGVSGLAGAGLAFSFGIHFDGGKLKGHLKAGLCFGLGAKGTFAVSVDVVLISEFIVWAFYQLCRLGDKFIYQIIAADAWNNMTQILLVAMDLGMSVAGYVGKRIRSLSADYAELLNAYANVSANAPRRNNLAIRLGQRPNDLLHASPRAKGFYLWELTRHGALTGTHYGTREKAIFAVLYSIQTSEEWTLVFYRMRPLESPPGGGEANRKALQRFLKEELNSNRVKEVEDIFAQLEAEKKAGVRMGWKAVWRDQKQQVALSHDQWSSYLAHNGNIPGITDFHGPGIGIFSGNQDTKIV